MARPVESKSVTPQRPGGPPRRPPAPRRARSPARATTRPACDGAGQLAAVRGLLPLVAEQRARRDRADRRLGLARAVGAEHVQVQARPQIAGVDDDLRPGVTQQTTSASAAPIARAGVPVELVGQRVRRRRARVVADAGPVPRGGQAARRPRAVQSAADDPDGSSPRVAPAPAPRPPPPRPCAAR